MAEALPSGSANLEAMDAAKAYQAAMTRLLVHQVGLHRGAVLDFGAGTGTYTRAAAAETAWQVQALEPHEPLHTHFAGTPVHASLEAIPLASLDAAYSLNVFEHIKHDVEVLRQLAARCKPGAPIFILVPAHMHLWSRMDDLVGHVRRYSLAGLERTGLEVGLTVEEKGWFDATGYFATIAYQAAAKLGLAGANTGAVSTRQVQTFDRLFALAEPVFRLLRVPFGKNCWIRLRVPAV